MIKIALGVLTGFALWPVLWLGSGAIARQVMPGAYTEGQPVTDKTYLVLFLILPFVYSIVAGYAAAWVAGGEWVRAMFILCFIQVSIGLFVQYTYWSLMPGWYHIIFLGLIIPGIMIGALWRSGGANLVAG